MQEILERVELSESESDIKQTTNKLLNEASIILEKFKTAYGEDSSEYELAIKEYKDIEDSILKSMEDDRKITRGELAIIQLEQSNLERLYGGERKSNFDKLGQIARLVGLDASHAEKFLGADIKRTNQYQEDLLKDIFGENYKEKGFNKNHIYGYNEEVGNYIIKIEEFESYLKDPNTKIEGDKEDDKVVNSIALGNYFNYVLDKYSSDIHSSFQYIKNIIGSDKLKTLSDLWRKNNNTITQNILNKYEAGKNIINIIKNPTSILDTKDENTINTAFEIGDSEFENTIMNFIETNKNDTDFKEKFITFYTKINPDSCSREAYNFFQEIYNNIINGDLTTQNIVDTARAIQKENTQDSINTENKFIELLGLGNFSRVNNNEENNNVLQKIGLSSSSTKESGPSKIEINSSDIEKTIKSLGSNDINTIRNLITHLDNISNSCPIIFGGKAEDFYKLLINKLNELLNKKMTNDINKFLISKIDSNNITPEQKENIDKATREILGVLEKISCSTESIGNINNILKKNNLGEITSKDKENIIALLKSGVEIQTNQVKKDNYGESEDTISLETQERLRNLQKVQENITLLEQASKEDFASLVQDLSDGKNPKELMQGLKEKLTSNSTIKNETIFSQNQTFGENITYTKTTTGYTISHPKGDIDISQEEFNLIESNKKAMENLISFRDILDELNLSNLWKYRQSIFKSIKSKYMGEFNENNNYLESNEIRVFLEKIMVSLGFDEVDNNNLDNLKQNIKTINNVGTIGGINQVSHFGSKIEDMFTKKFIYSGVLQENKLIKSI